MTSEICVNRSENSGEPVAGNGLSTLHDTGSALAETAELGPNGYRVGYTENGDKVEWLPDEDVPGQQYPMILRRNDKAILESYREFRDRVWWVRHKVRLAKMERGEREAMPECAFKAAKRIERKYGRKNLVLDDFEFGLLSGRLSALAWVQGMEWEDSLDT